MPLPRTLARFNRKVTNPLLRRAAGVLPGFAVVRHRGRTSGRQYRTPVNVFVDGDVYRFALTYGSNSDWVHNVLAAGGCAIETRGRQVELGNPRLHEDASRRWAPAGVRQILAAIGVTEYLECTRSNTNQTIT